MKINWIDWDDLPDGQLKYFARLFSLNRSHDVISNIFTKLKIIQLNNNFYFPVTINNVELENSFVCSPYTAYALYSKDELTEKVSNKFVQFPVLFLIKLVEKWLKFGNIDRNIHVNNYLLSTNPYPEWDGSQIKEITNFIQSHYPKHAIIFRSLNTYQHQDLLRIFSREKYRLIGSRQVYIYDMDYKKWWKRKNNKHDKRIIKKQQLILLNHEEMANYLSEAVELYRQLYLVKYSTYNPQFTLEYFKACHENKIMHFQGYKNNSGQLKAFAGLFIIENTITSPLVGYDTNAAQKEGLYIHAISLIMKYKFKHHLLLNLSSGAPYFKRLRGGIPSIEYSAIYTKHLSFKRRITWIILQFISNKIGVPLIKKYEL